MLKADQAIGTGNAEGAGATNQETGDGLGDQANGKGRAKKDGDLDQGDPGAADPEMPGKNGKTGTRAAKADAGKNGTGEGFELSGEQGGDDSASSNASRDNQDEAINAAPGGAVSGDSSGLPAKAKAPTKKAEAIAAAKAALAKAEAMKEDDDSTNGAQSKLPAKAKAPTKKEAHTWVARRHPVRTVGDVGRRSPSGRRDRRDGQAPRETTPTPTTPTRAARSLASSRARPFRRKAFRPGPMAPTAKNDGDADVGQKGKGKTLPDDMSGSGAQEKDVQTLKSETAIMQAISALAKSVQDSQRRRVQDGLRSVRKGGAGCRRGEEDRRGPKRHRVQRRGRGSSGVDAEVRSACRAASS